MHNHKIISIPHVVFSLEIMLHKLIKLIHVNIRQELRGEIAERQTLAALCRMETTDDFHNERFDIRVWNVFLDNAEQYPVINRGKEFADVTFKYP